MPFYYHPETNTLYCLFVFEQHLVLSASCDAGETMNILKIIGKAEEINNWNFIIYSSTKKVCLINWQKAVIHEIDVEEKG